MNELIPWNNLSTDALMLENFSTSKKCNDSYTKLLLHFNGTGSDFTDSSEYEHKITAYGNTTQSSTQSKFGGKSAYFDGSGDYLNVSASSDFDVGSGDFTVELWFYPTAESRYALFAFSSDFHWGMDYCYNGTRNVNIWASSNGSSWDMINADVGGNGIGSISLTLNTWNHIAYVRKGNVWRSFINGVKDIETTVSGTIVAPSSSTLRLGVWGNCEYQLAGYIDEFRFAKGIARWSTDFKPPASAYSEAYPPVVDSYTKLLLHADGTGSTFADSSDSAHTITAYGNAAQSSSQSKLGGKSALFGGSGDYLVAASSPDFNFGAENFTMDFWIRTAQTTQYATVISKSPSSFSTGMWSLLLNAANSGDIAFYCNEYSNSIPLLITDGNLINTGGWVHIALVRKGNVWTLYVNGTSRATRTTATTITDLSAGLYIGADQYYGRSFNGYIDELRISRGVARWSANFTPHQSPYCSVSSSGIDSYTKLMLHADGSGNAFRDSSPRFHTITAYGNATQDATQSKFGGKSAYFDGSGDYLDLGTSSDYALGTGDFTIDLWMKMPASGSPWHPTLIANAGSWTTNSWALHNSHTDSLANKTTFWWNNYNGGGTPAITSESDVNTDEWTHVAVVRKGSDVTLYINGTAEGSVTSSATIDGGASQHLYIGYNDADGSDGYYFGYIDEIRISKGIARWMEDFDPPVLPYSDEREPVIDAYTKLLLHADGTGTSFVDSSAYPHAVTANGGATQSADQSKFGGKSAYFSGSSYLSLANSSDYIFDGDFTVDFWVNFSTHGNYGGMVAFADSSGSALGWQIIFSGTTNKVLVETTDGSIVSESAISANTWHHIALIRSSSATKLYINGTAETSTISGSSNLTTSNSLYVGTERAINTFMTGYIDELRISKGIARWTADFTPPTARYSNADINPETKLLLHFDESDAAFTDSSPMGNTITNSSVTYTSSGKFAGAGSFAGGYLYTPYNSAFNPGTGDFTLDWWANFSSLNTYSTVIGGNSNNGEMLVHFYSTKVLYLGRANGGYQSYADLSSVFTVDAWHHYAIVRKNGAVYMFFDGAPQTVTGSSNTTDYNFSGCAYINIGAQQSGANIFGTGYIDEFRFIVGEAVWIPVFTPPISEYGVDYIEIYSETSNVADYTYALKLIAGDDAINQTMTAKFDPTWNLTGQASIKIKMAASRAGSNIKFILYNSDNNEIELIPSVTTAGTSYVLYTFDISSVADSEKNAINELRIKIINDDTENTVYVARIASFSQNESTGSGGSAGDVVYEAETGRPFIFLNSKMITSMDGNYED